MTTSAIVHAGTSRLGQLVCTLRGHHCPKPCFEMAPVFPNFGHRVYWDVFACVCGYGECLPYIVTAAGVVFLVDKCGRDKDSNEAFFHWRTL